VGIDVSKDMVTGATLYDIIESNHVEGGAMSGGPVCWVNGIEIPCFVFCSPKACIISELLAGMLAYIDQKKIFDLCDGSLPFLLLDGHQSRTQLPFLNCVMSDEHMWMVCIGVPYATHLWQVADSSELNRSYKWH
jgi:hypothetical protein